MNLLKTTNVIVLAAAAAAATSAVNGSIIDMSGWDGVMFIAVVDSATDTSVQALKAQQNTLNSTSGMADITGALATGAASSSQTTPKSLLLDVFRPQQRYLRPVLTRTTANAVVDTIIAIQYRGVKLPPTADATVLISTLSVPTA